MNRRLSAVVSRPGTESKNSQAETEINQTSSLGTILGFFLEETNLENICKAF